MGIGLGLLVTGACLPPPAEIGSVSDGAATSGTSGSTSETGTPADDPGATSMASVSSGETTATSLGHGGTSGGTNGETTSGGIGEAEGPGETSGTSEVGETSVGLGGTGSSSGGSESSGLGDGGVESSTSSGGLEEDPPVCLDPLAGIAWAGDWGKWWGAGCMYTPGVPEPIVVDNTSFGSDCTIIMADVWIPGVTDVDHNEDLIRTDLFFEDPSGVEADHHQPLHFEGRFGNNYRYSTSFQWGWLSAMYPYGTYQMRFRFSHLEENLGCWYTIGLGDGPEGGAPRTVEWQP